jgi:hypothetical protein
VAEYGRVTATDHRAAHPQTPEESIGWLAETVAGWNAAPPPFEWEGKRSERRKRARHRLLGGSAATIQSQLFAA